jgi:hypothetical protein
MKRISMVLMVVMVASAALSSLAPWPVQKEYYGVLAHWRLNDNQVAGVVAQYKLDDNAASTVVGGLDPRAYLGRELLCDSQRLEM